MLTDAQSWPTPNARNAAQNATHAWHPASVKDKALTLDTVIAQLAAGTYRVSLPMLAWCDTVVCTHFPAQPKQRPGSTHTAQLRSRGAYRGPPVAQECTRSAHAEASSVVAQLKVVCKGESISDTDNKNEVHYRARVDAAIKPFMVANVLPIALAQQAASDVGA